MASDVKRYKTSKMNMIIFKNIWQMILKDIQWYRKELNMVNEKLYTVKEVAKLFSVSELTVRRWIKAKKIKSNLVGQKHYIKESEIERLLKW